jgi:hypothetical protein
LRDRKITSVDSRQIIVPCRTRPASLDLKIRIAESEMSPSDREPSAATTQTAAAANGAPLDSENDLQRKLLLARGAITDLTSDTVGDRLTRHAEVGISCW